MRSWTAPHADEVTLQADKGSRSPALRIARAAVAAIRSRGVQWIVSANARREAGMSTAEYAVGTIAACGFAALLFKVVTSSEVREMLAALIQKALNLAG